MPLPTIRDVAARLETWAPAATAQSYDNVGLQVGDANRPVEAAVLALDLTPAVVEEAEGLGATLIITHHPLLFRPLKRLTTDGFVGALALRLAEAGIALYSIHTNLDATPGGVSFALGGQIGLLDLRLLEPAPDALVRLTVAAAPSTVDAVRAVLPGAFVVAGRAAPGLEETVRLEGTLPAWDAEGVRRRLGEMNGVRAVEAFAVSGEHTHAGLGAVGRLPSPMPLSAFLEDLAERLSTPALRYAGDPGARVRTVAVCGGSGSDFTGAALRAGADAYVTADVTYHRYFDVLDNAGRPRMALIDAGHYETEAITEVLLQQQLAAWFPGVRWLRTRTRTSPVRTFVARH